MMIRLGVLLCFFLQTCSSTILNETEYDRMPSLFGLDEYHSCLRKPHGVYCLTKLDLFSDQPSELMDMIRNYSDYSHRIRYNHTYIERGVCVTKTCQKYIKHYDMNNDEDLKRVIEACINQTIWEEYDLQARVSKIHYCDRQGDTREVSAADWAVLALFMALLLTTIYATIFHHMNQDNPDFLKQYKYLLCFSFIYNWKFTIKSSTDDRVVRLRGLDALRWTSSMKMVLGHVLWISCMGYMDNVWDFEQSYFHLPFSLMYNGMVVVQGFYVLSGFIFMYLMLFNEERHHITWADVPMIFIRRVSRLMPSLLAMLLFSMTWLRHLGSGPLWQRDVGGVVRDCRKYWWTHLLFINNYIPDNKQCAIQTWHLAADVQLFPLLLLVYMLTRNSNRKLVLVVLMLLSMVFPALHVWWFDLDAVILKTPEFLRTLDYDTFRLSFVLGHNNIGCIFLGMLTALKLYEWQKAEITLQNSVVFRILFWIAEPMMFFIMYMGTFFYEEGRRDSLITRVLYQATHRLIYGFFMSMLIIGSVMKLDRYLAPAMHWRVWQYYAILSYSIYLVHMNLVHLFSGTKTTSLHFTFYDTMVYYFGISVISIVFGFVLHMVVETPMNSLFDHAIKEIKSSGKEIQKNDHGDKDQNKTQEEKKEK